MWELFQLSSLKKVFTLFFGATFFFFCQSAVSLLDHIVIKLHLASLLNLSHLKF